MSMSRSEFLLKTMLFCIVIFTLVTVAHSFALIVKGDLESMNNDDISSIAQRDNTVINRVRDRGYIVNESEGRAYNNALRNQSKNDYDLSGVADAIGSILIGLDMPMPMPIIVTAFNSVMIFTIIYCAVEWIKSCIPLMPGG
jgi:hypothetical protein